MTHDYIKKIAESGTFSREEEVALFTYYEQTNHSVEVKNLIAMKNMGLVNYATVHISEILEYRDKEDLEQQGFLGLYHAIDKFDLSKGVRFSTYALNWIKQYIYRYIFENSMIHLPGHFTILMMKARNYSKEFSQIHGTEPTSIDFN